ncbi:CopG family ribbon-helix-helix protein [Alterisphingorhabdus coralli]|uniref:Ribbon-helix-helix protein, CopG family n=1 Tax=Alterisphingorhabdus coralli TaxID=3071408 RepID=A0AA97F947_9SPHN|nr:ribbon-helix-helix protein, CopG family [Parasphingorhabdus sp. SCSIO 66989]WOE76754.1 ribbon-helix-helix protein, CopG family [Parasphingorhabdus sp. SCSIO 66989]
MRQILVKMPDDLANALDAYAAERGQSRSELIRFVLAQLVEPESAQTEPNKADRYGRVTLKFIIDGKAYDAVKRHCDALHMKPAEYIRTLLYARFFEGDEPIIQTKQTVEAIMKAVGATDKIGRNLNDAVRSIKGAIGADNKPELRMSIDEIVAMERRLIDTIDRQFQITLEAITRDNEYWRPSW